MIGDFATITRVDLVSWNEDPFRYDVTFEVALDDHTGRRLHVPGNPHNQVRAIFTVQGLIVDLGVLTADQICAVTVSGSDFFPNWADHQTRQRAITALTHTGALPDLFVSIDTVRANGFCSEGAGTPLRLLRVTADPSQIK